MDVEASFLEFCRSQPEGVNDKMFRDANPHLSAVEVAKGINSLSIAGLIELIKDPSGSLIYRAIKQEEAKIMSQLEPDEKIVYLCIKGAENRGIWTKDLKIKTNLHQTVLNKVLKGLEITKRLIKSVKNVKNPTRKVYMLTEMTPSTEVTGGPWFSENELDTEFIDELCKVISKFITSKSFSHKPGYLLPTSYTTYPTLSQIHGFIVESGITSIDLSVDDVLMLVERLIFDGLVERITQSTSTPHDDYDEDGDCFMYRAIKSPLTQSALASIPCGHCPVPSRGYFAIFHFFYLVI